MLFVFRLVIIFSENIFELCRKLFDNSDLINYTEIRTYVRIIDMEGDIVMTDNEQELIKIIRENDNPEQALVTAVETILSYLRQRESSQVQAVADLRELA